MNSDHYAARKAAMTAENAVLRAYLTHEPLPTGTPQERQAAQALRTWRMQRLAAKVRRG